MGCRYVGRRQPKAGSTQPRVRRASIPSSTCHSDFAALSAASSAASACSGSAGHFRAQQLAPNLGVLDVGELMQRGSSRRSSRRRRSAAPDRRPSLSPRAAPAIRTRRTRPAPRRSSPRAPRGETRAISLAHFRHRFALDERRRDRRPCPRQNQATARCARGRRFPLRTSCAARPGAPRRLPAASAARSDRSETPRRDDSSRRHIRADPRASVHRRSTPCNTDGRADRKRAMRSSSAVRKACSCIVHPR